MDRGGCGGGFGGGGVEPGWWRRGRTGGLLQFLVRGFQQIAIDGDIGNGFIRLKIGSRGALGGLPWR
jgi:hypothetical protein